MLGQRQPGRRRIATESCDALFSRSRQSNIGLIAPVSAPHVPSVPPRRCAALTAERALCLVALRVDGNGRAGNFRQDADSGCRYSDNIHSGFEMTDV